MPMGAPSHKKHEVIPTCIDPIHNITHNMVMESDEQTVMTVSFHVTKAAEAVNAANLLVIAHAPELAQRDIANWKDHPSHSMPYQARN